MSATVARKGLFCVITRIAQAMAAAAAMVKTIRSPTGVHPTRHGTSLRTGTGLGCGARSMSLV